MEIVVVIFIAMVIVIVVITCNNNIYIYIHIIYIYIHDCIVCSAGSVPRSARKPGFGPSSSNGRRRLWDTWPSAIDARTF